MPVVACLLENGADPNLSDSIGESPNKYASYNVHLSIVTRLLAAGAHVDEEDSDTQALIYAADRGHYNVVKTLLAAGANTSLVDGFGRSALYFAQATRNKAMVSLLMQHNKDNVGQ